MINRLIEWSLRNRFLVACATLLVVALGVRAVYRTPVDAIPDLSENHVIVFADWPGRSPQEVEDQVTYPLSVNLQGLAGVKAVRANSMFGFTLITIIFEENIDNYFARSRVLERLNLITSQMPPGCSRIIVSFSSSVIGSMMVLLSIKCLDVVCLLARLFEHIGQPAFLSLAADHATDKA